MREVATGKWLLVCLPVVLLATWFYFEGLFLDRSVMHGDSIIHGYPVLHYHAQALAGEVSILWTELLYGGHPLHAEGQFAFFSPLNVLVAALFDE